jgi:hypothetical protein
MNAIRKYLRLFYLSNEPIYSPAQSGETILGWTLEENSDVLLFTSKVKNISQKCAKSQNDQQENKT